VSQVRSLMPNFMVVALKMLSRLDYCNAVLAGFPASTLAPLNMHRTRPPDSRSGLIGGHTHHYSAPEATLAAGQVPCHLQNCYYHSSDFPPSMPVVPLWPYRVCFGRLECTPTSLLHYSSRCRRTKQDAVRKACLLSGRPRHSVMCGLTGAKIAKICNFCYKFAPKGYIPLNDFFTRFEMGRDSKACTIVPNLTIFKFKM